MTSGLGTETRPLRVAIVGSGPSGFYAAEALLSSEVKVKVDVFDKLPTPFGLVRFGVAPDHPKIKSVTRVYDKVAEKEGFSYFGNVKIGKDLSVADLKKHYDAILFACGAQTDKRLEIPGIDLPGSYTATEFVAWYNGHPEYRDREFDLSEEVAFVVGQGNVAMDVSRILSKTADELKQTDIARHALEVLAESRIKEVHLIGRRGPAQTAFTPPELKEFGELAVCEPVVRAEDLALNDASQKELEMPEGTLKRKNYEILKEYAARGSHGKPKRFFIHFFRSPVAIQGNGRVERLVLEKNVLTGEPGSQQAKGTGEKETLTGGLFFRSVGYCGVPIEGVPFDGKRGVFPNEAGRIQGASGLYAVGWIKRGPSGVIGTNKADSIATVQTLLGDLAKLEPAPVPDSEAVRKVLTARKVQVVSFTDWQKIDAAELERGRVAGKSREKFVTISDMLAVLSGKK